MPALPADLQRWPHGRFWVVVGLVFAVQTALVWWMSDRSPAPARPVAAASFPVRGIESGQLLLIEDPTLFVLPHERGSQPDNAKPVSRLFRVESRPEAPRYLAPAQEQLGTEFTRFARSNSPPPFQNAVVPEPSMAPPELPPLMPIAAASNYHIEGPLKKRRLLSRLELRGWPAAELLTNSVVELLVNGQGAVVLAAPRPRGSGSAEADQYALQLARTLRFEPAAAAGPDRPRDLKADATVGTIVFEWQTLPLAGEPAAQP